MDGLREDKMSFPQGGRSPDYEAGMLTTVSHRSLAIPHSGSFGTPVIKPAAYFCSDSAVMGLKTVETTV